MKRKIAAILAADIVGYSRLVAEDEEQTLRRLMADRAVFNQIIARFGGRVFNTGGDSMLAEFESAVEATRCAVELQASSRSRNEAFSQDRRMEIRMGLTVGDVVEQEGDLFGDGVNIAARLEGLAPPGGIFVSNALYEQVASKLALQFADRGKRSLKNMPQPVQVYELFPRSAVVRMPVEGRNLLAVMLRRLNEQGWYVGAAMAVATAVVALALVWQKRAPAVVPAPLPPVTAPLPEKLSPPPEVKKLEQPAPAATVPPVPVPKAPIQEIKGQPPPIVNVPAEDHTSLPPVATTPVPSPPPAPVDRPGSPATVPRPPGQRDATSSGPVRGPPEQRPPPSSEVNRGPQPARCSEIIERAQLGELTAEDKEILQKQCR